MRAREFLWVFFLGLLCGALGEALLFLREQCARAESTLAQDFRVLAFVDGELSGIKAQSLQEQIRTLPGVIDVQYLSRDTVLSNLKQRDPSVAKSVSLLGENPLGSVFEIRLDGETLPQLSQWQAAAMKIPELSDLRFKPKELQAILQLRFYRHFATLALALAAIPWFLGASLGFWTSVVEPSSTLETPLPKMAVAAAATAAGMALIYAAASPMKASLLWLWPPLRSQWGLFLAGTLGAGFWIEPRAEKKMVVAPKRSVPRRVPMETVA